jgi:hypothetical protein
MPFQPEEISSEFSPYNLRMNSEMEPLLITEPSLAEILRELALREPIFHRPEWGTTRADFQKMTAPDFWEVGASGRRYSRSYVLDELERRYQVEGENPAPDSLKASGFHCRRLSDDVYLLTYTLLQGDRKTRRTTIWQRTAEGWKIVFHQGTIVQDDA